MPLRLVALDEGPDILVDRAVVVVGRHPQCDARLDSIRVSRRHCCMTPDAGDLVVRDLGSTNGIRINGQRVEMGRVRPGDELSIAHIRFRFDPIGDIEPTLVGMPGAEKEKGNGKGKEKENGGSNGHEQPYRVVSSSPREDTNSLAAAVRDMLPSHLVDRCRIQVIVQMDPDPNSGSKTPTDKEPDEPCPPDSSP